MSVLLDALKKAAEEKKNLKDGESVSSPKKDVLPTIENSNESMPLPQSDQEVELNSNHAEKVEDVAAFEFKLSDDTASDNKSSLNLEKELPPKVPAVENDKLTDELPEFDLDSLETSDFKSSDLKLDLSHAHANSTQSSLEENVSSSASSNELDDLVNSLETDSISEGLNLNTEINEDVPISEFNYDSDENNKEKNPNLANEVSFEHNISVENKQPSEFDSQSFDWSLDDLPGYNIENSTKNNGYGFNIEKNPILIKGAHSSPKQKKSSLATSSRVISTLFVLLFFVLIGFYGIHYFQEQNEKLERSMMKYNIASLNIQPKNNQQSLSATPINENTSGVAVDSTNIAVLPQAKNINSVEPSQQDSQDLAMANQTQNAATVLGSTNNQRASAPLSKNNTAQKLAPVSSKTVKTVTTQKKAANKTKQYQAPKPNNVVKSSPINRSVKKPVVVTINKTKSLIAEAYDAYKAGQYAQANRLFSNALNSDAKNTKALMGLGAVAVINKNYQAAVQHYERVLSIKPNDLNAIEAIANLAGAVSLNEDWDNQLTSAARNYPQSAVLQNALGNTYAKQRDWLEAQKAYFNALVNKPDSADYMVNLAVSYDHLGEYQLAAQYYTQALGHAQHSRTSFNTQQVKSRLVSIKQLINKGG